MSVSTVGTYEEQSDQQLASTVKAELEPWFGPSVQEWKLLRNYRIPFAQPNQACFLRQLSWTEVSHGMHPYAAVDSRRCCLQDVCCAQYLCREAMGTSHGHADWVPPAADATDRPQAGSQPWWRPVRLWRSQGSCDSGRGSAFRKEGSRGNLATATLITGLDIPYL